MAAGGGITLIYLYFSVGYTVDVSIYSGRWGYGNGPTRWPFRSLLAEKCGALLSGGMDQFFLRFVACLLDPEILSRSINAF